jgi:amidase
VRLRPTTLAGVLAAALLAGAGSLPADAVTGRAPTAAPVARPDAVVTGSAAAAGALARAGVDLDAVTIPRLQELIGRHRLTSVQLTAAYLNRIRTLDRRVNAVLAVNPRALAEAAASDRHRRRHGARSALEGIPVLLKDNIDTRDLRTTAGSRALLGARPDDATLTRRLRAAGAVVIGKANLSEWANFRDSGSTSGWSGVGGLTNNPYVLDRNACGSSSGSAAGVAASLAQVAIGTETDGSIVCPSGSTGVVGIKPTLGLVSRTGVVPISAQQDTAGPMARNVVDAALTLAVIQGRDRSDPATLEIPADQPRRYRLDRQALRGARIGVWRLAGVDEDVDKIVEQRVQDLRAAGTTVVEVTIDDSVLGEDEFTALLAEFKRDVNAYLAATPGRHPRDLAGLIAFNEADPVELRYFGQDIFLAAQASPPTTDPAIVAARTRATTTARALIDDTLAAHDLDAIVAPTNGPAWVSTLGEGDAFEGPSSSSPPAVAGYPSATVPAGFDGALPIGLSFIGSRWSEADVLSLAYAFEQVTRERRPPQYLRTVGAS